MTRLRSLSVDQAQIHRDSLTVVDVRDHATFASGHLTRSGNLTIVEFETRRAELPSRTTPVLIVCDHADQARQAAESLVARGFSSVSYLDAALADLPGGRDDTAPAARLWRPSPFLEAALPALPRGRAVDLAAGSGRDAVFLAMHGFEVEAWDHDPDAIERATALAARNRVELATVVCDLEQTHPPLPTARYDVVVCVRFLHRPLFTAIARALKPGGCLVYETFRVGQEQFGKPRKPQHLLESGELTTAFDGLDEVLYEETNPPGGPWMARLLARKPLQAES